MEDLIGGGATPDLVKDATIETFQADVMDASREVPVIVDFWAEWCGPCRTLGPILEKQVKARGGKVRMVKVDTDKNQMLAQQLRIQSLPTVMAFVGGQPVDGFAGALPDSQVSQFIDRVVEIAGQAGLSGGNGQAPDPAALIAQADEAMGNEDLQTAMQTYAMAADTAAPDSDEHASAVAGMARASLAASNRDQAEQLLGMIPEAKQSLPAVSQAKALMSLGGGADPAEVEAAKTAAANAPKDPEAHYRLGIAQKDAGAVDDAIDALLTSIELDRDWNDAAARQELLTVFEALPPTHPAVKQGRRRLSSLLFA